MVLIRSSEPLSPTGPFQAPEVREVSLSVEGTCSKIDDVLASCHRWDKALPGGGYLVHIPGYTVSLWGNQGRNLSGMSSLLSAGLPYHHHKGVPLPPP